MSIAVCTIAFFYFYDNNNLNIHSIPTRHSSDLNVSVTAHIDNPGQFLNRGIVSADQTDPNTNNNMSKAVDDTSKFPAVSYVICSTTSEPYYVGETIGYTLMVHNAVPSPSSCVGV